MAERWGEGREGLGDGEGDLLVVGDGEGTDVVISREY